MEVRYTEQAPPPHLASAVLCVWTLSGSTESPQPQLIVPDGCMELVLNLGDPFSVDADRPGATPRVAWVGEIRRPVWTTATGRVDLLGVRFAPGAATTVLQARAPEVVDARCTDDALYSSRFRIALNTVINAEPAMRVALLLSALESELARGRPLDPLVQTSARHIIHLDGKVEMDSLAQRLGASRRTLERRFLAAAGCSPKSLAQVTRFRSLIRRIDEGAPSWAELAVDAGYYDQAHLIRDFHRYTGMTPGKYLQHAHPLTDAFFQSDAHDHFVQAGP